MSPSLLPTPRPVRRAGRATAAVAVAVLALTSSSAAAEPAPELDQNIDEDQDVVTGTAELTVGHVDVGPRYVDDEWTLMVHDDQQHDDASAESVWRHTEETVFRVGDTSLLPVPEDEAYAFLGVEAGAPVHVVPQTQDPDVVWLGWNTQDPEVMGTIDRGVTLSLVGTEGPGHLVVYLQSGAFEDPDVLWDSRIEEPQPAWIPVNTHTHANWVFTEPGVHLVHLEVTADLLDGSTVTDTRALRFAVGDEVSVDEALEATPTLVPRDADASPDGSDAAAASDGEQAGAAGATDDGGGLPVGLLIGLLAAVVAGAGAFIGLRSRGARRAALEGRDGS